jgi:hypothetical protein
MVIGDMPPLLVPDEAPPRGPFRIPLRTSSKPMSQTPLADRGGWQRSIVALIAGALMAAAIVPAW